MMEALAYGLLFGGLAGWFLNNWSRRSKLRMHRWNRTAEFERARKL